MGSASDPSCNHIPHSSSFRVFREDFRQQLCRWPAGVEGECLLSKDGILSQHQRDLEKMKQAGFALCTSLLHCFA
ncbi:unnamed protein product [Sphagnum troendelagicum]|uniref:Uncharacterized protein n=1 Tax=Sphagnum troendelagicum TaxID=128251 RepID=A0ABP0UCT1_9BRYO